MTDPRYSVMKRHDTAPVLPVHLLDGTAAKDVSAATLIRFVGTLPDGTALNRATAERPADGTIHLVWQASDTATAGTLRFEVEVTWPDGTIQTFPVQGDLRVDIVADAG